MMQLAKDVMHRMEGESFRFEHLAIDGRIAI